MIKALLLHGADVDILDHKSQTPLLLALERHNYFVWMTNLMLTIVLQS